MTKKGKGGHGKRPMAGICLQKLFKNAAGGLPVADKKRMAMLVPYMAVFYLADKSAWLYRFCTGGSLADRLAVLFLNFPLAFENPLPSLHPRDLLAGAAGAVLAKAAVYMKGKNAKKYRQGVEYGSARWSA